MHTLYDCNVDFFGDWADSCGEICKRLNDKGITPEQEEHILKTSNWRLMRELGFNNQEIGFHFKRKNMWTRRFQRKMRTFYERKHKFLKRERQREGNEIPF